MKKAILYKKIQGGAVKCTACSWYCKISEGKVGICTVRQNIEGELFLLVHSKAAAANIDPMEKKPLFHFLPGKKIFSLGTRGCNFACSFCQNWDISQASNSLSVFDLPPEIIIKNCKKGNIPAIAFTYNEPIIFFEYAYDTMVLAKKEGIKTVFVSNGYASKEAIAKLRGYLDAINIDLKAMREEFYRKICRARLAPVLENIRRFYDIGIWTEITTLVIPGENDSNEELTQIAKFLASISKSIPWHVTRFHPDYKMLNKEETPRETLQRAYEIGKRAGLKYVYVGNVFDEDHESTYCPKCNTKLIRRRWYEVEILNLKNGKCNSCKTKIEGIWS